ncbi:MAG: hypothetical protein QOH68_2652 [Nocardioidaceae bacterium]|nr:hypothetical protein [Nocardioidaceae bacterium]
MAASSTGATASVPARCTAGTGQKVVRTTGSVRILKLRSGATRVCSRRTWRSRLLDGDQDTESSTVLSVRGSYVADQLFVTQRDNEYSISVRVLDADRAQFRLATDAFSASCCIYPASTSPSYGVRSAALGASGNLAWIASRIVNDPVLEVRYSAGGRASRLLDSDAAIDATSIALSRSYAFWQRADGARSARLDP